MIVHLHAVQLMQFRKMDSTSSICLVGIREHRNELLTMATMATQFFFFSWEIAAKYIHKHFFFLHIEQCINVSILHSTHYQPFKNIWVTYCSCSYIGALQFRNNWNYSSFIIIFIILWWLTMNEKKKIFLNAWRISILKLF